MEDNTYIIGFGVEKDRKQETIDRLVDVIRKIGDASIVGDDADKRYIGRPIVIRYPGTLHELQAEIGDLADKINIEPERYRQCQKP